MIPVFYDAQARKDLRRLPVFILPKIEDAVGRLAEWPDVSGVKHLSGNLRGHSRIRVRDYRIVFRCEPSQIVVERIIITGIGNRRDVYEE